MPFTFKESRRQTVPPTLFGRICTAASTIASGILSAVSAHVIDSRLIFSLSSTRPFLTTIEKKWIAYQLLRGIADSHAKNVYHGDIKTENVLVTSWNWAYLVDYAFYKPTYLPEVSAYAVIASLADMDVRTTLPTFPSFSIHRTEELATLPLRDSTRQAQTLTSGW